MQAIQEENQVDDEQEDHPERGEIEFDFLQQQKKRKNCFLHFIQI